MTACAVHNWRISSELVFGVISGLTRGGDLPAAVNEACWVGLATSGGETIFRGIVGPGTSKTWTERRAVTLELGNPGVVTLAVDGRSRTGLGSQPVTLSLAPVQGTSG